MFSKYCYMPRHQLSVLFNILRYALFLLVHKLCYAREYSASPMSEGSLPKQPCHCLNNTCHYFWFTCGLVDVHRSSIGVQMRDTQITKVSNNQFSAYTMPLGAKILYKDMYTSSIEFLTYFHPRHNPKGLDKKLIVSCVFLLSSQPRQMKGHQLIFNRVFKSEILTSQ